MATWPATLPQSPEVSPYRESFQDTRVRTKMETGPPKMRQRQTAKTTTFAMGMTLTDAQVETLETFYDDTLNGGVDEFTWKHPRTDAANSMRFVSTIDIAGLAPDTYKVSFAVEQIPA